jgi:iron complex transport system substrate-binding protein
MRVGTHRRWLVVGLAAALAVTGCGTSAPSSDGADSPVAQGFPLTVTNCGITTTYDRAPNRAVALNQHAIETMLALDLQGSMVGTAYLDDRILPEYRAAYDTVPVIADEYPSYEALLATEPDFIYGGWMSAFDEEEGRGRQRLADAGIDTYLNIEDCTAGPVTMSTVDDEIRSIGSIFGVTARAEEEIQHLHRTLSQAQAKVSGVEPVGVAVYDSGQTSAYTAGGHGIGNEMIKAAGGVNLFADVPKAWADVSFEQFAERAPDVIVIYDYGDQTAEQKKNFLLHSPVLARVPAIRDRRFAVLPLSSVVVGVRVARAVESLARQLHPDRFA